MGKKEGSWGKSIYLIYFLLISVIVSLVAMMVLTTVKKNKKEVPSLAFFLDEVSLDEVNEGSKDIKYYGNTMELKDGNEKRTFDDVEFKGRGNASWQMDKKSYRIKLEQKYNLLGLGKVNKWGLISNGIDDSSLRNDLAYWIGGMVNEQYKIKGEFVDLSIDEESAGLYYLVKLVEVGKSTINLKDSDGLIVELDNAYCETGKKWQRTKTVGDCLSLEDSVSKDDKVIDEAWSDFMHSYNKYEEAILDGDYEKAGKYMDLESLAEYYLVGEFASNPDMYVTSWYMYKDGENDRIHCVMAWDFDAAFGNKNWWDERKDFYTPYYTMARLASSFREKEDYEEGRGMGCRYETEGQLVSPILCYAIDVPEFKEKVNQLYREKLQERRKDVVKYIEDRADYIREAAIANNELWGMGDFEEAVDYLVWWVEERFDYFDETYVNKPFEMKMREI